MSTDPAVVNHELEPLQGKSTKKNETNKVPFTLTDIFKKYSTKPELVLMLIGFISAIGFGSSLPVQTLFFGQVIDSFNKYDFTVNHPEYFPGQNYEQLKLNAKENVQSQVLNIVYSFIVLAVVAFICAYLLQSLWCYTGAMQSRRIRLKFFHSMLKQPVEWHDQKKPGELTTHLVTSMSMIQDGISEKFVNVFNYLASFVAGFIIAFVKSWKMTLVLLSVFPILVFVSSIFAKIISNSTDSSQHDYAEAGGIAQECLSNVRVITAYNAQTFYYNKFNNFLLSSLKTGKSKAIKVALALSTVFFFIFANYGLGFWYGSTLVVSGELTGGTVLNVFFAVMFGAFVLGNIAPAASAISSGNGAWAFASKVIETAPEPVTGTTTELNGQIVFKDVDFTYPNTSKLILDKFNLTITYGSKTALVGSSGSGKSTVIQLILKFYKPTSGTITVNGVDLQDLDTKWWRDNIGLVSQEPMLFDTTIAENILFGLVDFSSDVNSNMNKIEECSKMALAHDFIQQFPDKYLTPVGEKGGQLSGGQKQRIAIARSMIKNPSILLLDEATSALDSTSERVVQEALDTASANRTTVAIAHRLSTIKDADKIIVMGKGSVLEQGNYNELLQVQGEFYKLVQAQGLRGDTVEKEEPADLKVKEEQINVAAKEVLAESIPINKWPLMRLFKLQKAEIPLLVLGSIGAILNGALFPVFNLFFSQILSVFAKPQSEIQEQANFWSIMFIVLAVVAFLANFSQNACFTLSGERLTFRIRQSLFKLYMQQDIAYFDDPVHSSGALSTSIAEDAEKIKGLTGELMGIILQFTSTVVCGLGIGFYHNAELTALILIVMPFAAAQGFMEIKVLEGFNKQQKIFYASASTIATDALGNIRTVLSLNRQNEFLSMYGKRTELPHNMAVKGGFTTALLYAFSQASTYLVMAYAFWIGSVWLINDRISSKDMFVVIFSIIFSAMGLGQVLSQAKNIFKAASAAKSYFELMDRVPPIKYDDNGDKPVDIQGKIALQHVEFRYPQRMNSLVINNIDYVFEPGKTTALVGSSGSGKSTVIQLLERFYDPLKGNITNENINEKDWNLKFLRDQIAIVSQDPVLFRGTIYENIGFGALELNKERAVECAKMANIHSFIDGLPEKYDSLINNTTASGGQKQRIVIARALYKNPKYLLLDEATSALDTESERIVQEALDVASKDRTTIVIAHRLSTIQNAHKIIVMAQGEIIEIGTHDELYRKGGVYTTLVNQQKLE
eukprot:NODE_12_length_45166_cov_0.552511.p1 type:complete len:1242 gc:universal NODE_12_length_45166_cov_0.552511:5467-9192(+)